MLWLNELIGANTTFSGGLKGEMMRGESAALSVSGLRTQWQDVGCASVRRQSQAAAAHCALFSV